jgi:phage shock protein PspC (stress-responsive transcriptional regulator)
MNDKNDKKDMKDKCEELLSRVIDRLASGDNLTEEELTHLKAFAACREALTAATHLEEDLMSRTISEPDSEVSSKAVDAIQRDRQSRIVRSVLIAVGLIGAIATCATWMFASFPSGYHAEVGTIAFVSVLIGTATGAVFGRLARHKLSRRTGFLIAMLSGALFWMAYRVASTGLETNPYLYRVAIASIALLPIGIGFMIGADALPFKRLYRGRVLSGVLMGIAEEFGWRVFWVRLVFLLVLWLALNGPWLFAAYLLLDACMQPHPDDRVHMWRFRIARWLRARTLAPAGARHA